MIKVTAIRGRREGERVRKTKKGSMRESLDWKDLQGMFSQGRHLGGGLKHTRGSEKRKKIRGGKRKTEQGRKGLG